MQLLDRKYNHDSQGYYTMGKTPHYNDISHHIQ